MRDRISLESNTGEYDDGWGWRKSSFSMSNGACLEVRNLAREHITVIGIRDSKAPEGPMLQFGPGAWSIFLAELRTSPSPFKG
jgi:Domain of unknown function (DUF397)